jgi:hypothetical protein
MSETLRECREILGASCEMNADSCLLQRCSCMLEVLLQATKNLCEKATGPQTPVAKFELLTGTDALFNGIDVESRTVKAAIPDVDDVMKKVVFLRRSPGFRKLLSDVLHGVLIEQDVDWVMVPLLRDLVVVLEEFRALIPA